VFGYRTRWEETSLLLVFRTKQVSFTCSNIPARRSFVGIQAGGAVELEALYIRSVM